MARPNDRTDCRSLRESRVININRVAKVVKGGRRFSFTALVVIGDGAGRVGLGYGKAKEVPLAIQKGTEEARKNLFAVPLAGCTITHPDHRRDGRRPRAAQAGRPRYRRHRRWRRPAILEEAGIHDVLCKSLGSSNHINVARATIAGLQALQRPDEVARLRGPRRPRSSCRRACSRPTSEQRARPARARRGGVMAEIADGTAPQGHPGPLRHRRQAEDPRHAAGPRPARHRPVATRCPTVPRSGA